MARKPYLDTLSSDPSLPMNRPHKETKMDATKELEKAYRALQALYRLALKGQAPDRTMIAYHSPTIGAALRFVDEGALDGSEYFVGKPIEVLHEALKKAQPR